VEDERHRRNSKAIILLGSRTAKAFEFRAQNVFFIPRKYTVAEMYINTVPFG
jgi:hypothetical protein